MNKSIPESKIRFFESVLSDFFLKAGRDHLPWRREGISAYEVWVSEVMLQQTQVPRVISYYEKFLKHFPTVEDLARASWEEFLPYYAGLGYYVRGRNMLRTAKMVVETYDGEFPNDINALQKLPGIGAYTACAIASFAYGADEIAWDTNVRRVIGRFFSGTKNFQFPLTSGRMRIEEQFSLPAKMLNAALMDFGSAICTGKPKCAACPLAAKCRYFKEKGEEENKQQAIDSGKQRKRESGKKNQKFSIKRSDVDWKTAKVTVFLHENHKKYFSSGKTSYRPFVLDAGHSTRAGIKAWFRERYGLEVSVRPPHAKRVIGKVPMIFVNAQILSGEHAFQEYTKETHQSCVQRMD